jgi:hypothetical protein
MPSLRLGIHGLVHSLPEGEKEVERRRMRAHLEPRLR